MRELCFSTTTELQHRDCRWLDLQAVLREQLQKTLRSSTAFYLGGKKTPGDKRKYRERSVLRKRLAEKLADLRVKYGDVDLAGKEVQDFELEILVLTVASALLKPCKHFEFMYS